jgi:hypothetical protein
VSKRDRPNLPIFAIGAGAVHLIALAILLPLLITLPGPGRNAPPKPVNVEVDLGSPAEPKPIVPDVSSMASHDETAALPAGSEPGGETPNPLANVGPQAAPSFQDGHEAAPASAKRAATTPARKLKAKVQANVAKSAAKPARAAPHKRTLFARGSSFKPFLGGSTARSKAQGPSWSALLNSAPSAADVGR